MKTKIIHQWSSLMFKPWHLKQSGGSLPELGKPGDAYSLHISEPSYGQKKETNSAESVCPKGQNHVHLAKANIKLISAK